MSSHIVLSAPYQPPAPPGNHDWRGMRHTLTGWDGSTWEISDPDSGVCLLGGAGLEGLGMPEITNYTTDSAVVAGSEWNGYLVTGRKVFLTIGVFSDTSSAEWLELDRAFWRIFRPGKTVLWTVDIAGRSRSLRLRFTGDGGGALDFDPVAKGWNVYGVELFPEQPLWEGAPEIRSYEPGTPADFYGPNGLAPDFVISASSNLATATMTNPGDEETFIKWTIVGQANAGAKLGVNGAVTTVPMAIAPGSKLVVDTDPRNLTAELDGVDVMDQFGDFDYAPLPAGADISLTLDMVGAGRIDAEVIPLYFRGL